MRVLGTMEGPHQGPSAVERRSKIEVVRASNEHAEALAAFFRVVWDRNATAENVRAAQAEIEASNPFDPGARFPRFLFLSDGDALGHIGTIPTRFWNGNVEHSAHWYKGLMVHPEHRNGPVGYLVLKEAARHLGLSGALVVAEPARKLFKALGFIDAGAIANYLVVLRPARVLRALDIEAIGLRGMPPWLPRAVRLAQRLGLASVTGVAAVGARALWRFARSTGTRDFDCREGLEAVSREDIDDLWRRARAGIAGAAVRDGGYISWRYDCGPLGTYEVATVRDGERLVGLAVVRKPRPDGGGDARLRGIKVATLSDILFPLEHEDAGMATLAAAESIARRAGADALLCSASHRTLTRLLPRCGYLRLPGNVHFLFRDPGNAHALPVALDDWWLTRGDADSDDAF